LLKDPGSIPGTSTKIYDKQKRFMKFKRIKIFLCFFLILLIAGCVTIPTGENIPAYSIGGATYFPLVSLCDLRGVAMQYDPVARTAYLHRDGKSVNLRVGDALILVNNNIMYLSSPVDIYQSTIVVPRQFKEQVFDILYKKSEVVYHKPGTGRIKLRKVVIDAGHGGHDPGAIGRNGLREKDVNLDIAKRLSGLLKQEGVQTVLTRSGDNFIPLSSRVNITNKSDADLFISIHSNANRSRSLCGLEVYYVAPSVSDSTRAAFTARNASLNLKDAVLSNNSLDLKAIIWDMIYTNSRAESIELSNVLCKVMDENIDANILGVKNARFQVLKGIRIPGILIEVGFVSNSNEERLLRSGVYRQKLAEGILESLRSYSQEMALIEVISR